MSSSYLYHEQQLVALCGCHALNNLLQGPFFGAGDLADLALALDNVERGLLDTDERGMAAADRSHRVDTASGDFSIEVLQRPPSRPTTASPHTRIASSSC